MSASVYRLDGAAHWADDIMVLGRNYLTALGREIPRAEKRLDKSRSLLEAGDHFACLTALRNEQHRYRQIVSEDCDPWFDIDLCRL